MKEEMLEAIYGTVERLEQKVDELSASPKNTEAESTPVSVSVDTSKLEKAILAMAVKEGEAIDKLVRLREAICIFTDLTKKEASKDEQRSKLLFDTISYFMQHNRTAKQGQTVSDYFVRLGIQQIRNMQGECFRRLRLLASANKGLY